MRNANIEIIELKNSGDMRGSSYTISSNCLNFLSIVLDIHFLDLKVNGIRGNHYHKKKKEIIIVKYIDKWKLLWKELNLHKVKLKEFYGIGAVIIKIPPFTVHTIVNNGKDILEIICISNEKFNQENKDIYKEILFPK
jgi:dTDP-4-dehydrorhamnose 3,5-epimerase-like enzyme